jgi:hypothetical protein
VFTQQSIWVPLPGKNASASERDPPGTIHRFASPADATQVQESAARYGNEPGGYGVLFDATAISNNVFQQRTTDGGFLQKTCDRGQRRSNGGALRDAAPSRGSGPWSDVVVARKVAICLCGKRVLTRNQLIFISATWKWQPAHYATTHKSFSYRLIRAKRSFCNNDWPLRLAAIN